MNDQSLRFEYRDSKGVEGAWALDVWQEVGLYIKASTPDGPRTFRKDRVLDYMDGCESLLKDPFPPVPPTPQRRSSVAAQGPAIDIVFSCFSASDKAALSAKATESGFYVRADMTKTLKYICFGTANFAPAKLQRAMEQGVCILTEQEFVRLCETGELPS